MGKGLYRNRLKAQLDLKTALDIVRIIGYNTSTNMDIHGVPLEPEDQTWLNSDASKLAEYGSYSWKPGEIEKGKPVRFVAGKGFLIED